MIIDFKSAFDAIHKKVYAIAEKYFKKLLTMILEKSKVKVGF